ncbi:diguanylate cyclase [Panacagrimonas sp.]|uniref:diguanylate cyclase n=1 Tax=Panacagrimonas sp. TaxID=2480088 RepID=UPI003B5163FE
MTPSPTVLQNPTRGRPRLLVVDDQSVNIRVMHLIFQAEAEVLMATSGKQALDVAAREQPDLILLDIMMPDLDGLEVCRRLKATPDLADTPVIFVTGQSTAEEETTALDVGAVDFIAKPVNPAVVRARVRTHLQLREQSRRLAEIALTDGLTGVPNRRHFDAYLEREWAVALREQTSLAVIMIDVDHFKAFNDCHGHLEGDETLRWTAATLRGALRRPTDLLARYGGEEYVCLLPRTTLEEATSTAVHLRQAIAAGRHRHDASPVASHLTISLGVAATKPRAEDSPTLLVQQADERLYQAKRSGRNRVGSPTAQAAEAG